MSDCRFSHRSRASFSQNGHQKVRAVGAGGRAIFFYTTIVQDYQDTAQLVAFCDTNKTRMAYANIRLQSMGHRAIPTYLAHDFDNMIRDTAPDEIIIMTIDHTHHKYIIRALELGCNVITEKPMTIDASRCREILDAVERTQRRVRVTLNYRYAPHNTKIHELIMSGAPLDR